MVLLNNQWVMAKLLLTGSLYHVQRKSLPCAEAKGASQHCDKDANIIGDKCRAFKTYSE